MRIIHVDDEVVVVDKPPGLPVVPASGAAPGACVRKRLEASLGSRLWVVHRLDRDTSGVLVLARTADAHRRLCAAFERRLVRKTYLAFTHGWPSPRDGRIDTPLHLARRGKVRPARPGEPGALESVTRYVVRKRWAKDGEGIAMIEARPETGRHHQIRAHLRSIGTPILFDPVYGRRAADARVQDAPARRLALHASRLFLPKGVASDSARTYDAPLEADLVALLHRLDDGWAVVMVGE